MIKLYNEGGYVIGGSKIVINDSDALPKLQQETGKTIQGPEQAKKGTMTYSILAKHNQTHNMDQLNIKFDTITSHDITSVGIIQTARVSGLVEFPIPYVMTNCHNSLCAVGGTINEDDHVYALSAAKKYGGIYVPPHQAVIHQFMREMMSGCGKMILGADSHTRYGALGTMSIGEGGPELVKQLLEKTYDITYPDVVGVHLTGKPRAGVGPQDVALAIIGTVFKNGFVNNKVMEFIGEGVESLSVDYRMGIDVMTTETTCLSSIWTTDPKVEEFYAIHGRNNDYKEIKPDQIAYYDQLITIDLSQVESMIALPFHPSNAYTIKEVKENLSDIIDAVEKDAAKLLDNPKIQFSLKDKIINHQLVVDQGVIAGCAGGTYENICDAADIVNGKTIGQGHFSLSIYPSSQPVFSELVRNGSIEKLMTSGSTIRTAFCGPCFGAGDVPANNALSIRHTTRNFINREGSKPTDGQIASVALMDARSIAATAINGGKLTAATELEVQYTKPVYSFNKEIYHNRIYNGYGKADPDEKLIIGPNITDWPPIHPLAEHLLLKVASVINDPVTTTDEIIPSGETSSYRSNPQALAEYTLSRKDPLYTSRAKLIRDAEEKRVSGQKPAADDNLLQNALNEIRKIDPEMDLAKVGLGSVIYAMKPGDGSAREQAASCQRVLGGWANIALEYATKRYRSNLINWGILPFTIDTTGKFLPDDFVFIPEIKIAVETNQKAIKAIVISSSTGKNSSIELQLPQLTHDEKSIILSGCLMNFYRDNKKNLPQH